MCKTKQIRYVCKHLGAHLCVEPCSKGFDFATQYCKNRKNKRVGFHENPLRCEICSRKNRPIAHSQYRTVERRPAPRTREQSRMRPAPPSPKRVYLEHNTRGYSNRNRSVGYKAHHSGYGTERSTAYRSRSHIGPRSRLEPRKSGNSGSGISCMIM